MKSREWFEQHLYEVRQRKAQLLADLHAHEGVEQFILQALKELDRDVVSPLELVETA